MNRKVLTIAGIAISIWLASDRYVFADNNPPTTQPVTEQAWNLHFQNTDTVQGDPAFSARYSGPNSLNSKGEVQETVSADVYAGLRLWPGAEGHVDGLMWQGFGIGHTTGIEDFPDGEAFKAGTEKPEFSFARLFVRQTFGLGGDQENVADDQLTLAGKQDISRVTLTLGRFSPTDIFDTNAYAGDARQQFMNWAFITNPTWDYPSDALGFTTGFSAELNQPMWALRYGFFQMPNVSNSWTAEDDGSLTFPAMHPASDGEFFKSWGMVGEFDRRYTFQNRAGTIRFLAWLNSAHMGSYEQALSVPGADIAATRAYRLKYGFALNIEQAITQNVGVFSRLGWNDGHEEAWTYTDVNYSASLGTAIKGESWRRPDDTFGLAGVISGISRANQKFLEAGGVGILDGDGALNYRPEKLAEAYYSIKLWKPSALTFDYQFVDDPAFNRDRGPVSIFGARLQVEY